MNDQPANRPLHVRMLAIRQRWLLGLIVTSLLLLATPTVTRGLSGNSLGEYALSTVWRSLHIAVDVLLLLVLAAKNEYRRIMVLYGIMMLVPLVNLFILAVVLRDVNLTLRRAGLRVGILGADLDEVERLVDPQLCRNCNYSLRGNVSGTCPECGTPRAARPRATLD